MTELSEISVNSSEIPKLSINFNDDGEETNQIRCPLCSSLTSIIEANFQKNFFSISCNNDHEDIFINFHSFSSFIENVSKNLENILCNNCKKSKNEKEIFRCDKCYLFLCEDCKINHENKLNHLNYNNLNDIDNNNFGNDLMANNKKPEKNEINKEYHNIKDNINICKNISELFKEWIIDLTKKFNSYMTLLNNYFSLEKIIISNLKEFYDKDQMYLNKTIFENYGILYPNKYFINNYIKSINLKINSSGKSFRERSLLFINLIQNFDEIDDYFKLNTKPLDLVSKSKSEKLDITNKIYIDEKISDKVKIKLNLEEIVCFNSYKNDKYLLIGTKKGNLSIYEIIQDINEKNNKLSFEKNFKMFENELRHICIIENNNVIISDGNKFIKIIKFDDDIINYTLIQTIFINNRLQKILPLNKPTKYFCTSDDNDIIIYKEIENEKEKYFSENKIIKLNTLAQNLIEVYNKYLIASCPKKNKIIFFEIKNDFKEAKEINKINLSDSNNNLLLINENKILVVGTMDGFELISIKNLMKIKSIHCKYSIICLEKINENNIICYNDDKNKKNKIRQFMINEENYKFKKISERIIDDNDEISKLNIINGRIFFLNKNDNLFYLV